MICFSAEILRLQVRQEIKKLLLYIIIIIIICFVIYFGKREYTCNIK